MSILSTKQILFAQQIIYFYFQCQKLTTVLMLVLTVRMACVVSMCALSVL